MAGGLLVLIAVGSACTTEGIRPSRGPTKSAGTLRVATWNVENFPKVSDTPELVASVVSDQELDLVAFEEIASESAFSELERALPDYASVLSTHVYSTGEYQKLAFLYRRDVLRALPEKLLFEQQGFAFPRPPLEVEFETADGWNFVAIALHLKAGRADEDRARRAEAMVALTGHADELVKQIDEDVMMLGDYNEILTTEEGRRAFGPLLERRDDYYVATERLATSGDYTFVPSRVMFDHIVTSSGLRSELSSDTVIPALDHQIADYEDIISDHLPVIVELEPAE